MKLTAAETRIVEMVRRRELQTTRSGTIDGNIVKRLLDKNVLTCARRQYERGGVSHWGTKFHKGCSYFMGLRVNEG